MTDQSDTDPKGDQKPAKSPPSPPIPPQNETILPGAEQNPPAGRQLVTVNLPSGVRPIEWLQLGINAALVVVGVVAIYIYGGQLNVMRGQLGELVRQYPELKKAADAAESSLTSQKISFQTDQRPYVVANGAPQFITFPNEKTKTRVNVILKDIGKTPATNATWFVALLPYGSKRRERIPKFHAFLEASFANLRKRRDDMVREHAGEIRRDISPTDTIISTEEARPLLASEMAGLMKEDADFILLSIGIVNYTDGFRGAYETEFCYFFVGGADQKLWHLCESHNTIK